MTPLRLLALSSASVVALAATACRNSGGDNYDTSNPYGTPQYGGGQAAATTPAPEQAANPVYDTPAAYEETSSVAPAPESAVVDPGVNAPRSTQTPSPAPSTRAATATVGGTAHVVVKGDTLGGIAHKYGVSAAAIKKANGMTKDTVVLGKTLQIPAH